MPAPPENLTARGIGILRTTVIDLITAHDGTVIVITEPGMIDGSETIDEFGIGEIATGIATADTRTA
jgi:uncharacterized protein (DUF362 family)